MPLDLALFVALLTGWLPATDRPEIHVYPIAVRAEFRAAFPGSDLESSGLVRLFEPLRRVAPDPRTSVAILISPREDADEGRETEEEVSQSEHDGRPFAAAGLMIAPWNGPPSHARPAPDPSHLGSSRSLFLLHGRLTC